MGISKDDWEFMKDLEDPNYEDKYENLIKSYATQAYNDEANFPNRYGVTFIYNLCQSPNWLCKIRLPLSASLTNDKDKYELNKLQSVLAHLEAIGMTDDLHRYFGNNREAHEMLIKGYFKLLKKHKRGFEEEEKAAQSEREARKAKAKAGFSKLGQKISALTNAFVGNAFVSDIGDNREKQDLDDKGDQDYGE